jgi:hypothetical protein
MKRIRTTHHLPFPREQVWAVLADFGAYSEWNPLNLSAEGEARVGARVPMRFVDAGGGKGKVVAQTVTVTACEQPRSLEWFGRIPLLFTGRHFFELEENDGGTRLIHGEDLSGLIPMLFSAERVQRQKAAYEQMNLALERRLAELTSR